MRCKRCGKVLKDVESQERGYGPVCWAIVNNKKGGFIKKSEDLNKNAGNIIKK